MNQYPSATLIEYPATVDTPRSPLSFSPCTKVGTLLFVSGQASVDDAGSIIPDTFEGEMRRAVGNLQKILHAAGSSLKLVVQTRNYVRDPVDLPEFNRLYRDLFSAPYPARTTITRCLGEALKYEIECIAVAQ